MWPALCKLPILLKFKLRHILSDYEDCLSDRACVIERGSQCSDLHNFGIVYMRLKIEKFSWGCTTLTAPNIPAVFGTNHSYSLKSCFSQIFPNVQYSPNDRSIQIFLNVFKLLFGFHTVNFGQLSRDQLHSPDVSHHVLTILTPECHRDPCP